MTKEKAIKILKEIIEEGWLISDLDKCIAIDACEMAIEALEQKSYDKDNISRQKTIEAFYKWICCDCNCKEDYPIMSFIGIEAILEEQPPASAEKTGHWIDTGSGQKCSECGEIQYRYDNFRRFCASCGAKMGD